MSVPARLMGIADVFEALTAKDRPYKRGKMLSEALEIMKKMSDSGHIDSDIFEIFIKQNIFREYAKQYMDQKQIDEIDEKNYLSLPTELPHKKAA